MPGTVAVRYGSPNDAEKMKDAVDVLRKWGISHDVEAMSAHRDADKVAHFARTAQSKGYVAVIAGAGMSNALAGDIASYTNLPVIGVPLSGGAVGGLDAILSTVQMPPGVPVAGVALEGSANAALQVIRNLAVSDPQLARMYRGFAERGHQVKAPMPIHSGKVRDTFQVEGENGLLMQFVSDRISAYDWVLDTPIPGKGAVLAALTRFWLSMPEIQQVVSNHLLANETYSIGKPWMKPLTSRLLVVKKLNMIPLECIVRGYLEGSAWREYEEKGTMHGTPLPEGMLRCQKLQEPVFTPSTKATEGEHDENISVEQAAHSLGTELIDKLKAISLELYIRASTFAEERGILILDTKFEFGYDPISNEITLADEVFTPDSSRFVDAMTHSAGRPPKSMDKEHVRTWLREDSGWGIKSKTPPPQLPPRVVYETSEIYGDIAERLTGTNPIAA